MPDFLDRVRDAWAEALDIEADAVPLDESFFEAGGNSLLLLLLWERLNEMTARDLKAADLFQHSTVRAQTELLAEPERAPELSVLGPAAGRTNLLGRARRNGVVGDQGRNT